MDTIFKMAVTFGIPAQIIISVILTWKVSRWISGWEQKWNTHETRLESHSEKIEKNRRLWDVIFGNGQPGMRDRLTKLEQRCEDRHER